MDPDPQQVAALADRIERIRLATEGITDAERRIEVLANVRRAAIHELHAEGWSYAQIAEAAGLSRGWVHQVHHQSQRSAYDAPGDG